MTRHQREALWVRTHRDEDYRNVWSLTDDPAARDRFVAELASQRVATPIRDVLVPGCGSRVALQNDIATKVPGVRRVLCTDYQGVIDVARERSNDSRVEYAARDSTDLGWCESWDAVVVCNSIVSESDQENRAILASCREALRPGGILVGFFPTIMCALDIAYRGMPELHELIDPRRCVFHETKQGIWQVFYSPLMMRLILIEAGFILERLEIFFCDSDFAIRQNREYYGIQDPDLPIYEMFVVARKGR
jgi:SAM-dependent methyltransferase